MDYKEEYQKALERAKRGLPIDEVFPELKEGEDERIMKEIIGYLTHRAEATAFVSESEDCERWATYLEKHKEQKPAEWSEEDEEMIDRICAHLEFIEAGCDSDVKEKLEKRIKWMRRLKFLRPPFKPSKEQMDMLRAVLDDNDNIKSATAYFALESLYNDLKKLI